MRRLRFAKLRLYFLQITIVFYVVISPMVREMMAIVVCALPKNYAPLQLLKGDRVEPAETLPDVNEIFKFTVFPRRVTFWRHSRSSVVLHRCPLWNAAIGLVPTAVIAVDLLHAFYLGPLLQWAKTAVWAIIESEIFAGVRQVGTGVEKQIRSVTALNASLYAFYGDHHRQIPTGNLSRVNTLTPRMVGIGGKKGRRLKTRAMETWGVALFLVRILSTRGAMVGVFGAVGPQLLTGGNLLIAFMRGLRAAGPRLTDEEVLASLRRWKDYMAIAEPMGLVIPKSHMMYHLVRRAKKQGNPCVYQTFMDESLNKNLKHALRLVHQQNFESSGLAKFQLVLSRPAFRRRVG